MSNFLYGTIITVDNENRIDSGLDFSMVRFALQNDFAIRFIDTIPTKDTSKNINFQISDNFFVLYCESFLETIIYTPDGIPLINNFDDDLDKLQGLVREIFNFEFVEKVELRFSFVEVDEVEYEICETCLEDMKDIINEKFLNESHFPVINVIIER